MCVSMLYPTQKFLLGDPKLQVSEKCLLYKLYPMASQPNKVTKGITERLLIEHRQVVGFWRDLMQIWAVSKLDTSIRVNRHLSLRYESSYKVIQNYNVVKTEFGYYFFIKY